VDWKNMKVGFVLETVNFRGTTVAVSDYAYYNQEILGNESVVLFDSSIPYQKDMGTEQEALAKLQSSFHVIDSTKQNLQKVIDTEKLDTCYFIKYGHNDFPLPDVHTAVHAVFQAKDPHGDRYAYISEWLSEHMGGDIPFVPHIVELPEPNDNYRKKLNIGDDKIVIGRYGGYLSFDLSFVREQLKTFLEYNDNFVFLMVNTEPFYKHPNIRYIDTITDVQKKSNLINTCDAMLHARMRGESFGLSIAEFLSLNKPVLAWEGGLDLNHTVMLKDSGLLYDEVNFLDKLKNIKDFNEDWSKRTVEFKPSTVMKKFKEVFL
jgi:hypothetical protein